MSIRSCDRSELEPVLNALELSDRQLLGKYIDLGFEKEYNVYLAAGNPRLVVKLDDGQGVVYERWLDGQPDLPVPQLLGTAVVDGHTWHAFEERGGEDLQCLRRETATAAGKSLARLHARFWSESPATNVNGTRAEKFALVAKHFPELSVALTELADRAASAPSTLCENDLLPMNVLWDGHDATIIDFGHADISPYFGDPARFVAFGKPEGGYYVQPTDAREKFLTQYFEIIRSMAGTTLDRARFDRDIALGEIAELSLVLAAYIRRTTKFADVASQPEFERILQLAHTLG